MGNFMAVYTAFSKAFSAANWPIIYGEMHRQNKLIICMLQLDCQCL